MDELIGMLTQLAECRLDVSRWLEWWDNNQSELKTILPHADYMRIKPRFRDTPVVYRILEGSQAGAEKYLTKSSVPFVHSNFYAEQAQADWAKHLQDREQEFQSTKLKNQQKRERLLNRLAPTALPTISLSDGGRVFLAHLSSLTEAYRKLGAEIEYEQGKPVSTKEIIAFEEEIGCVLPDPLKNFLCCSGTLHFTAALPQDWVERVLKPIIPNCNSHAGFDISLDEIRTAERSRRMLAAPDAFPALYAANTVPAVGFMEVANGDVISIHRGTGEILYLNHDGDDFDGYVLSANVEEYLCNLLYVGAAGKEFWEWETFTPYPQAGGINPRCDNACLYRHLIGWL